MKVYPSWRYHRTEAAKIVHSEEEDQALGEGWADTPAAFEAAQADTGSSEPKITQEEAEALLNGGQAEITPEAVVTADEAKAEEAEALLNGGQAEITPEAVVTADEAKAEEAEDLTKLTEDELLEKLGVSGKQAKKLKREKSKAELIAMIQKG